jgi:hypothetical protein
MTAESRHLLARSTVARAVYAVLRWVDLSVPGLAMVFGSRLKAGAIRRAVLELRRLGLVNQSGWSRSPL